MVELIVLGHLEYSKPYTDVVSTHRYSGLLVRIGVSDDYQPCIEIYEVADQRFYAQEAPSREELENAIRSAVRNSKPQTVVNLGQNYFWKPEESWVTEKGEKK